MIFFIYAVNDPALEDLLLLDEYNYKLDALMVVSFDRTLELLLLFVYGCVHITITITVSPTTIHVIATIFAIN